MQHNLKKLYYKIFILAEIDCNFVGSPPEISEMTVKVTHQAQAALAAGPMGHLNVQITNLPVLLLFATLILIRLVFVNDVSISSQYFIPGILPTTR